MDPLMDAFLSESRELLETAGRCFLELEKTPGDQELLNDLFRAMHTIKGSSGLFEIQPLTHVVHAAEDVLDVVREGDLYLDSVKIDLLLDSMDHVNGWLDEMEQHSCLGEDAEAISQGLMTRLRTLLDDVHTISGEDTATAEITESTATIERQEPQPDHAAAPLGEEATPDWLHKVPDEIRQRLYADAIAGEAEAVAIEYMPGEQCFFSGDDPLHTARQLPGLLWLEVGATEPWPTMEEFDPYRCQLRLRMLSRTGVTELNDYLRYVVDEVTLVPLHPEQLVFPTGTSGETETYEDFLGDAEERLTKADWVGLQTAIEPLLLLSAPELIQTSALHWLQRLAQDPQADVQLTRALLTTLKSGEFQHPVASNKPAQACPGGLDPTTRELLLAQLRILSIGDEATTPEGNLAAVLTVLNNMLPKVTGGAVLEQVTAAYKLPAAQAMEQISRILLELLEEDTPQTGPDHNDQQSATARALLQAQSTLLSLPVNPATWEGILASAAAIIRSAIPRLSEKKQVVAIDPAVELACKQRSGKPLIDLIEPLLKPAGGTKAAATEEPQKGAAEETEASTWDGHERCRSSPVLKVDQARIDTLMDLIGELVVAKNALPYLANDAEQKFDCAPMAKSIKTQYTIINRITEELQSSVMQVRMVPVSSVFQRFPRLVRDLSRKLDKQIQLIMEGEDTEIDKNVVEDLPDPMVHLIRNSIDHGIELPAEREAAGKPAGGTIRLRAVRLDDQVLIEISDDGKGIDSTIIKHKAYEKGVIDEKQLDSISDQDALQLILAPGFSTAEEVTALSGRGVGMDVVNNMVNKIGGSVVVESTPGSGSTIRLALPLSMAVTQVMMIDVGDQSFGVPLESIVETVKIPATDIQKIKQREMVVLRERLIPVLRLHSTLDLGLPETVWDEDTEIPVLVIQIAGQELGLLVDRFHAGMDVILKPMEGIMSGFHCYSGTALLGDGRVLLILNLQELKKCL